jgi:uncharacterized protein YbjT (DUF2867 family)
LPSLKVIITGATGMVGEGVLLECLQHPAIEQILLVSRKPYEATHHKLKQCIVPDFLNLEAAIDQLAGYDACFFCAGISSRGMSEPEYTHITLHFARTLASLNPRMIFCYVSGSLTDSSETGRVMWARVKGRTENALIRIGFSHEYNFRPGFMKPTPGQRNVQSYYKLIGPLYPVIRAFFPNHVSTMREVALAIINSVLKGYPKQILEIKDINSLASA